ncbi:MAG: hypothetical protein LLF92_01415 [Planctomycetaceae bacterium]|nr:hypothetical protein [Planctomycetaceae bacterium]
MCGSLDTVESAQMAIDSYNCLNKENIKDIGQKLIIYGLFQALYIQQDAVLNLCKSIGIPLPENEKDFKKKYPEVYEIRQLRNKGIGHPSKEGNTNSTHGMLIDNDSIELFSYTETGQFSYSEYKISDCIKKQNQSLCGIIQEVIKKMESIEKEHKDKYKQNKLRDCFPTDPQYCIGKVFEAINLIDVQNQGETTPQRIGREGRISLASSNTNDLIKSIDKLNKELIEREVQDVFVSLDIEHSKYPLEKLKKYFEDVSKSSLNSQDARVYADSANVHILDLIKSANKLDDEYAKTT